MNAHTKSDPEAVDAAAEQAWRSSPDVRAEFGYDKARWSAYRRAEAEGLAKTCAGQVQRFKSDQKGGA